MTKYFENPAPLIEKFNEMAATSQNKAFISIGIEIQEEEIKTLESYREELEALKKGFVDRNLENEANLVYCIDNSLLAIQNELQMLVNIKKDKMLKAWGNLVDAQVAYGTVIDNCPFGLIPSNGYVEKLLSYEKLLFPNLFFQSVGGIITKSHCSICKQSLSKCDHIKGKLYMGEMCCRIVTEMELEEVSLVENPANKHCRILTIEQNGKKIDIMTLREESTTSNTGFALVGGQSE